VEIIDEKIFGASYQGGMSSITSSTATIVYVTKGTSPDGKEVEIEIHCCYPFNNNPTIKIKQS